MTELLQKLLPILFLILIGVAAREAKILTDPVVLGLKNIIIKIALPVILFRSFATMKLEVAYLLLFILVFVYCGILYFLGDKLHHWFPAIYSRRSSGGFFTGFEFGMIGVGLFGAIWGIENLAVIMLIGFGHELFIWFLYVPLVTMKNEGQIQIGQTIKAFLKTPTIIGILLGVLFNIAGIYPLVGSSLIGGALYGTFDFLAPLTSPLILMIIGYSLSFKKLDYKEAAIYILSRWGFVLGLGLPLLWIIHRLIPGLDPLFTTAYFAFILLPAPYILPLFIGDREESDFFSQLLVYSTVTSFVGYIVLMAVSL